MSTTATESNRNLLEELEREHATLKARVAELSSLPTMTADEKVEYQQLKKKKLRTKDRIRLLEQTRP